MSGVCAAALRWLTRTTFTHSSQTLNEPTREVSPGGVERLTFRHLGVGASGFDGNPDAD